jgi:hypothetical protein
MKIAAIALSLALAAAAQTQRQREIVEEIYEKAAAKEGGPRFAAVLQRDPVTGACECDGLIAAWLLESRRGVETLFHLIDSRTGVETGAAPGTPGAGSLTMRGAAPMILSMALESGGVAAGRDGTVVTFRSTPRGLVRALAGGHPAASAPGFLDRFSGSASFDMARGSQPGVLTARADQLTAWSARWAAVDRRDPRNATFRQQWSQLAASGSAYRDATEALALQLPLWPELARWQEALAERVEREVDRPYRNLLVDLASARRAYASILLQEFARLRGMPVPEPADRALARYARELTAALDGRQKIRELASRGALLAIDFTSRGGADHDPRRMWLITAVLETFAGRDNRDDFVLNASIDSRNRFHTGVAYEIPRGVARFTIGARYSSEPRVGRAASAQGGVAFAIPSTGFRVPLSITASRLAASGNTFVSIQLGLHYNADLLFLREWLK